VNVTISQCVARRA